MERSNRRKEKRKTLSLRWKISSLLVPLLTLEPMLSVQKAKIGRGNTERMASLFRDGSEIRGTAFHRASINEFPVVHRPKMIAIGTMDKVVLIVDGTRLMNEAVV